MHGPLCCIVLQLAWSYKRPAKKVDEKASANEFISENKSNSIRKRTSTIVIKAEALICRRKDVTYT